MKKTVLAMVAVLATATMAFAGDLPSKKAAPPAPAPAPAAAPASADTSISFGFGFEADPGTYNKANKNVYTLGIEHNIGGGVFIGANAQTGQAQPGDGAISQNLEALAGYRMVFGPVALKGSAGVGERFTTGSNFPYYVGRLGADYNVADGLTWNAVQYRYRNAFDTVNNYESHRVGTGLTYSFARNHAIYTTVYRDFSSGWDTTGNGIVAGYKVSF